MSAIVGYSGYALMTPNETHSLTVRFDDCKHAFTRNLTDRRNRFKVVPRCHSVDYPDKFT